MSTFLTPQRVILYPIATPSSDARNAPSVARQDASHWTTWEKTLKAQHTASRPCTEATQRASALPNRPTNPDPEAGASAPLLDTASGKKGESVARVCCFCSATAMTLSVLCLVGLCVALFVRIDSALNSAEVLIAPHAAGIVRNAAAIVNHTASATDSLAAMGKYTTETVAKSAPLMTAMVNATHEMVVRMNRFTSRNPSISIGPSLGLSLST